MSKSVDEVVGQASRDLDIMAEALGGKPIVIPALAPSPADMSVSFSAGCSRVSWMASFSNSLRKACNMLLCESLTACCPVPVQPTPRCS